MNRRSLLRTTAMIPVFPWLGAASATPARADDTAFRRVRPTDAAWPTAADWERLGRDVGGQLVKVRSPLADCLDDPKGAACAAVFKGLKTRRLGTRGNSKYHYDGIRIKPSSGLLSAVSEEEYTRMGGGGGGGGGSGRTSGGSAQARNP